MCPNCKCKVCQKIIDETRREDFLKRIKMASEIVSKWSKWKQDILKGNK